MARDDRLETKGGKAFGGVFIRHLMDKHPAFLEMLRFAPTLSIARACSGPRSNLRGFTGRVCYPDDPNQETEWHFHQRVIPDPRPAALFRPQTLDALLYLDDIDDRNGPLCVVPARTSGPTGTWRRRISTTSPGRSCSARRPEAASLPTAACGTARSPRGRGTIRRLLLFGYGPAWMKPSIYGRKPEDGLTAQLLQSPDVDEETRELLGASGYM